MQKLFALIGLALTGAAIAPLSAPSRPAAPTVRVLNLAPFKARGTRFRANERIRVVLYANRRYTRTVTASAAGSFVVKFDTAFVELCTAYTLRVSGFSGSRVTLTKKPPPPCAALDPVG